MIEHAKFDRNTTGRDFVIGDLHGNYKAFERVMAKIGFDDHKDRMFAVGDLIDRGEQSKKCLELTKLPWFHSVLGNHEDMMVKSAYDDMQGEMWIMNGGMWHISESDESLAEMRALCRLLPVTITIADTVGISHAECPSFIKYDNPEDATPFYDWNLRTNENQTDKLIWGRRQIKRFYGNVRNIKKTYHGHTPKDKVVTQGNATWIDTGACWEDQGGFLTCIEMEY